MTAHEKIIKYLRGRKLGATVPEIVKATGLNANTVRRTIGHCLGYKNRGTKYTWRMAREYRITSKVRTAYVVQP